MPFAKRSTAAIVRRPVTSSPKFVKLQARLHAVQKRASSVGAAAEHPMLVLGGAALPALIARFTDKPLPTLGGIDPELLLGGGLIAVSFAAKGKNRARLLALGTGAAAPAVNRAIKAGTIKVGGDDDDDSTGDDGSSPEI